MKLPSFISSQSVCIFPGGEGEKSGTQRLLLCRGLLRQHMCGIPEGGHVPSQEASILAEILSSPKDAEESDVVFLRHSPTHKH